ncbi:MAG TPA: ASPIC/UnbV domain-containing protein, partial [Gemmataceae bacterium]|nr:ASPIC/UnbV domain-containing protein [Gemmataceae bacterium]
GSYFSAHDRRLLIGLGLAEKVEEIEVRWPNAEATVQRFGPMAADKSYMLVEGARAAAPALCPPIKRSDTR